ncbi:hypothetical protein PPL_06068 [Heterostelium album PN500]|uniref:Methyltransferase type 11 domain-containing protein n=1 Tax=Heterostelium pallidum (strain ATCC 26659 / Pp 5 / PN500) TaxID=670386 RepID=D3BC46_HETP5|nr:hypothetical protein PPL_06068 [Heterostelium album PN500]EFA81229.1 hypothetical protein PPL_06068 [Heterostelium album PN500]|eukprot:XP_020433347.1 hypothetical protein PPL_06068 [Heterostelium album PN500]
MLYKQKKALFANATGRVLDVGSGVGPTFKYLVDEASQEDNNNNSANRVTSVVSIEPNPFMQEELKRAAAAVKDKYDVTIIQKTIGQAIKDGDIENGTFDTVICNLVLCSIPEPEKILNEIQQLLKPGGKFLFIEHVVSKTGWSAFQSAINPLWNYIGDGCSLIRHTDETVANMSGWSSANITEIPRKKYIELRHVNGICIKE